MCFGREFQAIGFEKTYSNKDDIEKRNNNDEDEPSEDIDIQKMKEDVILKTQKHLPLLWWGGERWWWWWWWHVVAHDRRWKHRRDHVHLWMDELFVNYLFYMLVGNKCQHLRTRMIPIVMSLMRNYIIFCFYLCDMFDCNLDLFLNHLLFCLFVNVFLHVKMLLPTLWFINLFLPMNVFECNFIYVTNWLFLWTTIIDKHHHNKDLQLHFFCDGMIMKL